MRLIFAGTPLFAARALSALLAAGHDLCMVLTQPDRPSGRGMKLVPGAVKALEDLKARGARLAICTNKREPLAVRLLRDLRLSPLFDAVAGLETFAVSKPHPGHILGTIRTAGGSARLAIMVGDSANDINSARAAGVPVVGCTFGYSETPVGELKPDVVMSAYSELPGIIAGFAARQFAGFHNP